MVPMILTRPQLRLVLGEAEAINACGMSESKLSGCVSLCDSPEYVWNAFSSAPNGLLNTDAGVLVEVIASVTIESTVDDANDDEDSANCANVDVLGSGVVVVVVVVVVVEVVLGKVELIVDDAAVLRIFLTFLKMVVVSSSLLGVS